VVGQKYGAGYWNKINKKIKKHHYKGIMSDYKIFGYSRLLKKWNILLDSKQILVTDLFDEAYNSDNLFYLASDKNKSVVGIDISEHIAKKAKGRYKTKDIVVCDVRHPPFKEKKFDIILSPSTLDHFPEEQLQVALNNLSGLLTKKGRIIITLHNRLNIWLHFYISKFLDIPGYEFFLYSRKTFNETIRDTNLKIVNDSAICHLPCPILTSVVFSGLSRIKILRHVFENMYKSVENLENTKIRYLTGELLIFELKI